MTRPRLTLLMIAALIAVVTAATSATEVPGAVRMFCGIVDVLLAPGFALISTARPENKLHRFEELLASVGLSLALATGMAVLLAALPIGLTRTTLAVALAVITVVLAVAAWIRPRAGDETSQGRSGLVRSSAEGASS